MPTFDEFKSRISIIQVLEDLGYKLDKSKGKTMPVYKLVDDRGMKIDEVVIKNPLHNSNQYYFDRNHSGGDLIAFIKNHIERFSGFYNTNLYIMINSILSHYANIPFTPSGSTYFAEKKNFDENRYREANAKVEDLTYLYRERKISIETIKAFLPFIFMVEDKETAGNYRNIGFPYSIPGQNRRTNYEFRNYGYKGMAAGGDKTNSVWMATSAVSCALIKNVYFFESAIDAMSFFDLHNATVNLNDSAFISVGGYVTRKQVENTLKYMPQANVNVCFDNDINGRLYDIITYCVAINKDVKISKKENKYTFFINQETIEMEETEVNLNNFRDITGIKYKFGSVHKAKGAKDFNEILKSKENGKYST